MNKEIYLFIYFSSVDNRWSCEGLAQMYIFKFYKYYPRIANVFPCSKNVYLLQNHCNLDLLGAQSMYEINTCHVLIVEA